MPLRKGSMSFAESPAPVVARNAIRIGTVLRRIMPSFTTSPSLSLFRPEGRRAANYDSRDISVRLDYYPWQPVNNVGFRVVMAAGGPTEKIVARPGGERQ